MSFKYRAATNPLSMAGFGSVPEIPTGLLSSGIAQPIPKRGCNVVAELQGSLRVNARRDSTTSVLDAVKSQRVIRFCRLIVGTSGSTSAMRGMLGSTVFELRDATA